MTTEVEVTAMSDAFEFSELTGVKERKRIFNVGSATGIVAELVLMVFAKLQALTAQTEVRVPLHAAIAPILIPLGRFPWMAE